MLFNSALRLMADLETFLGSHGCLLNRQKESGAGCHLSLALAYGYASGDVGTFRVGKPAPHGDNKTLLIT